jgi:hypothetical protein
MMKKKAKANKLRFHLSKSHRLNNGGFFCGPGVSRDHDFPGYTWATNDVLVKNEDRNG